jgi:hypothetical protein
MRGTAAPRILCGVDRRGSRETPGPPQWWRPGDARLQSMFETRTDAWRAVGLQDEVRRRDSRRARLQALVLLPLLAAVIAGYALRHRLFGASADTPVRIAAVVAILILGWAIARDVGRAAAPTLFRHLDPASAGTVGFLMRLATLAIALLAALSIAQVSPTTLVAGGAFTAVIVGLAAQQTLGNLFAGLVLVSARPFRVGQRVRLQAGVLAGETEGVVSSLGLLYTTLARGERRAGAAPLRYAPQPRAGRPRREDHDTDPRPGHRAARGARRRRSRGADQGHVRAGNGGRPSRRRGRGRLDRRQGSLAAARRH